MKKLMLLITAMLTLGISAVQADNDRIITVEQLPQSAQQFIKKYFPQEKIAYAKMERDFLETTYEVVFANSSKVEFEKNGEWKEVDCKYSKVPEGIVPKQISTYVSSNYPQASITQIDRDKHDYEVKLTNRLELTFDLKFNLIDIDD